MPRYAMNVARCPMHVMHNLCAVGVFPNASSLGHGICCRIHAPGCLASGGCRTDASKKGGLSRKVARMSHAAMRRLMFKQTSISSYELLGPHLTKFPLQPFLYEDPEFQGFDLMCNETWHLPHRNKGIARMCCASKNLVREPSVQEFTAAF